MVAISTLHHLRNPEMMIYPPTSGALGVQFAWETEANILSCSVFFLILGHIIIRAQSGLAPKEIGLVGVGGGANNLLNFSSKVDLDLNHSTTIGKNVKCFPTTTMIGGTSQSQAPQGAPFAWETDANIGPFLGTVREPGINA